MPKSRLIQNQVRPSNNFPNTSLTPVNPHFTLNANAKEYPRPTNNLPRKFAPTESQKTTSDYPLQPKPILPVIKKSENIINADIVVHTNTTTKEATKEQAPVIDSRKPTKAIYKDKRTEEVKKPHIIPKEKPIAPTTKIRPKSDMEELLKIMKDLPKGEFTYEVIKRIGAELTVCHMKPTLLNKDVLTRAMRNGKRVIEGKSILMRREKTEEEKKIEKDAREHVKLLVEKAKVQDVEGDIKLALNKLTPENYEVMFDKILNLKNKSSKVSEVLVNKIFKKAWSEPTYIELYGHLCKELICKEVKVPYSKLSKNKMKDSKFRDKIITKCQITFNNRNKLKDNLKKTLKEDTTDDELNIAHRKLLLGSITLT